MTETVSVDQHVAHNRLVHDRVAPTYEKTHTEIFNHIEQARVRRALRAAVQDIQTGAASPLALDFGAGTGNLTRALLEANVSVVASDVSPRMLEFLQQTRPTGDSLTTALLNGVDLREFADGTFDMVATYSVLHHVVDYLAVLREFVRVTKPGGVIYIDHEVSPEYWNPGPDLLAYQARMHEMYEHPTRDALIRTVRNLFSLTAWKRLRERKLHGVAPLDIEGDVHVTLEDHIDWDAIGATLAPSCDLLREDDFLICREQEPLAPVYHEFRTKCSDMRARTYRVR